MYSAAGKSLAAVAAALVSIFSFQPTAQAATLAQGYNAFIFGDFTTQSSDVEGRLAVGGNMNVTSYSVGDKITDKGGTTLVVGGNLTWGDGQVYHGNALVGGTYTGPNNLIEGYSVYSNYSPLPVDFDKEKETLLELSEQLANLAANGSVSKLYSTVDLVGNLNPEFQVFDVDGSLLLSNYSGIKLDTSSIHEDATVIVNISGTDLDFMNGLDGFTSIRERVIFNFYEATTLNIGSIAVQGTVLAPYATIEHNWGVIWGQVIAENYYSSVQVNHIAFNGKLPPPPDKPELPPLLPPPEEPEHINPNPEPASAAFLMLGAAAAAVACRRRR